MGRSFFLFARPSFLGGMSRLLDFGGTLKIYNESHTEEAADRRAFCEDWKAVGDDLRQALAQYRLEIRENG